MMHLRSLVVLLVVLLCASPFLAQAGDGCHVYVVDVAAVEKAQKSGVECTDPAKCGVTTFPDFKPKMGEEELTTKTYRFAPNKWTITAKVFFTDEMLASARGADSILMSITLSPTELKDVLSDENSAAAEFTLSANADAMRVKRFYRVNQKSYLIGLECHFKR